MALKFRSWWRPARKEQACNPQMNTQKTAEF